jgi:hypothetical protein
MFVTAFFRRRLRIFNKVPIIREVETRPNQLFGSSNKAQTSQHPPHVDADFNADSELLERSNHIYSHPSQQPKHHQSKSRASAAAITISRSLVAEADIGLRLLSIAIDGLSQERNNKTDWIRWSSVRALCGFVVYRYSFKNCIECLDDDAR